MPSAGSYWADWEEILVFLFLFIFYVYPLLVSRKMKCNIAQYVVNVSFREKSEISTLKPEGFKGLALSPSLANCLYYLFTSDCKKKSLGFTTRWWSGSASNRLPDTVHGCLSFRDLRLALNLKPDVDWGWTFSPESTLPNYNLHKPFSTEQGSDIKQRLSFYRTTSLCEKLKSR